MRYLFIILAFMVTLPLQAKMVKVAVIDTGFDFESKWPNVESQKTFDGKSLRVPKMCKTEHKDFTGTGIQDKHGHGTHVSGIVATYAEDVSYCIVAIKYYTIGQRPDSALDNTIKSFEYAVKIGADVINYSGGGTDFSFREYQAVQKALDKGIVIVAAAGNESLVINQLVHNATAKNKLVTVTYTNNITLDFENGIRKGYYPANYDKRIYSVVNLSVGGSVVPTSNRGAAFTHSEVGEDVKSIMPQNHIGTMTGTSQAAPKITAKIIKGLQDTK